MNQGITIQFASCQQCGSTILPSSSLSSLHPLKGHPLMIMHQQLHHPQPHPSRWLQDLNRLGPLVTFLEECHFSVHPHQLWLKKLTTNLMMISFSLIQMKMSRKERMEKCRNRRIKNNIKFNKTRDKRRSKNKKFKSKLNSNKNNNSKNNKRKSK